MDTERVDLEIMKWINDGGISRDPSFRDSDADYRLQWRAKICYVVALL